MPIPQSAGRWQHACRAYRPNTSKSLLYISRRAYSQSRIASEPLHHQRWMRSFGAVLVVGAGASYMVSHGKELHAETPSRAAPAEMIQETRERKEGLSKEDNRASISNQHLQVKRSWENPGVYAWGSNAGKVVAPDSDEATIKNPRRISFFDGLLLRDLKLTATFGAAIDDKGDLIQWGTDYSTEVSQPRRTLKGKNLVSLAVSANRIIGLSSSGAVYSIHVSKEVQDSGAKPLESSWIPLWPSTSPISYRTINPPLSSWSDRVISISSGLSHLLLLTSSGRVFSAASSSTTFPEHGQLGVPGLSFNNRPVGAFDLPHELSTLRGFDIKAIATGDNHSLVLDSSGRLFSFGSNSSGQLGFEPSSEVPYVDAPSLLPLMRLYTGTSQTPLVRTIAAGGSNSFFTVDATRTARRSEDPNTPLIGRITADTWACGSGILGSLGNGRWTHNQGNPSKVKTLSGLFEYDESTSTVIPIRLARFSVGATHAAATMANVTHVGANAGSSENDTNWGADVVWWGGNEHYQLGTGKRNNVCSPMYIGNLDGASEEGGQREDHRFHVTPKARVKVNGRWVNLEQRVECGRYVSAVYSGV